MIFVGSKFIPAEETIAKWLKNPKLAAAYAAFEDEFALASSLIRARTEADANVPLEANADSLRE